MHATRCALCVLTIALPAHAAFFTGATGSVSLEVDGAPGGFADSPDPLTVSTTGTTPQSGTATLSFTETPTSLRLEGVWDGMGTQGFASTISTFIGSVQASEETEIEVSWDVSGMASNVNWGIFTTGVGGVAIIYDGVSLPTVGTQSFVLGTGQTLSFQNGLAGFDATVTRFETPGVTNFIDIRIVPAPSSLALIVLSGLLASRGINSSDENHSRDRARFVEATNA